MVGRAVIDRSRPGGSLNNFTFGALSIHSHSSRARNRMDLTAAG
jgi:hypothetical protein